MKYKERVHYFVVDPEYHFNFSGMFSGYCCFCSMHAGGGSGLFDDVACYLCREKREMLEMFSRLFVSRSGSVSWRTHGWAALPGAILDKILRIVAGESLAIEDGVVKIERPGMNL